MTSRGDGGIPRQEPGRREPPPHRLVNALRQKFREAVTHLMRRPPTPQPGGRRRRTGETVGAFRRTASRLLRPVLRFTRVSAGVVFLQDALDWLHLWDGHDPAQDYAAHENSRDTEDNHLSPRP